MSKVLNAVTLLGAGVQGSRLAYMWSRLGRPVYLLDNDKSRLPRATHNLETLWSRLPTGRDSVTIDSTDNLDVALARLWLVVEVGRLDSFYAIKYLTRSGTISDESVFQSHSPRNNPCSVSLTKPPIQK